MVEAKYLGAQLLRVELQPIGHRLVPDIRAIADPDRAAETGVAQRLRDQAGWIGEAEQPRAGAGLIQHLGVLENSRDAAQPHGEPARPGGLLPQHAVFERDPLIEYTPLLA